jgi:hypothetical protein
MVFQHCEDAYGKPEAGETAQERHAEAPAL